MTEITIQTTTNKKARTRTITKKNSNTGHITTFKNKYRKQVKIGPEQPTQKHQ